MATLNQVVRFALSDAAGVGPSGLSISSKIEAGAQGLLLRGCTQVGGVCTDYSGNIYVSDSAEHAIYKIDEGGRISILSGLPGTSGDNTALMKVANGSARFDTPKGLACDKSGRIYVADSGNNQIRVIDGPTTSLVAGLGNGASGFVNGTGAAASFNNPTDVAVDNAGIVYVADTGNHAIRQIKDGEVLAIAGDGVAGDTEQVQGNDGARFSSPRSLTVTADGTLIICDTGNNKLKKINPSAFVSHFSGSGSTGRTLGTSLTSTYNELLYCDIDKDGSLYVIDFEGDGDTRLLKVDTEGEPSVIADLNTLTSGECAFGVAVNQTQKLFVVMSGEADDVASSSSSSSA